MQDEQHDPAADGEPEAHDDGGGERRLTADRAQRGRQPPQRQEEASEARRAHGDRLAQRG